ncbi:hypothetical protein F5Y04DRAFT_249773 [Hypomontagnella monticulosa]|nr:hypothetical protein F5Y04DRAFT_249773 [Hypomontagnella monticulosa]
MAPPNPNTEHEEEEEDDYMNMTFGETDAVPSTAETSLQRRQRLKREGEIRGRVKSKAEVAADERAAREQALSRSLLEDARAKKSKGFAMMAKMGFKAGAALGSAENRGLAEPLRPEMKEDRGGIGLDAERKRKLGEAADKVVLDEKKRKIDESEFRDRTRREHEQARWERQFWAGMKVCERMDEGEGNGDGETTETNGDGGKKRTLSTRPLKSIPVVYRALIRSREEAERDRRMRHDLEQSSTRLPKYVDDSEDEDDKKAIGKTRTEYVPVEDLEEEDPELDEFNELEVEEKLRRLVEYLRKEHNYCFWCKCSYPDGTMDGCPGLTEEDHD